MRKGECPLTIPFYLSSSLLLGVTLQDLQRRARFAIRGLEYDFTVILLPRNLIARCSMYDRS